MVSAVDPPRRAVGGGGGTSYALQQLVAASQGGNPAVASALSCCYTISRGLLLHVNTAHVRRSCHEYSPKKRQAFTYCMRRRDYCSQDFRDLKELMLGVYRLGMLRVSILRGIFGRQK